MYKRTDIIQVLLDSYTNIFFISEMGFEEFNFKIDTSKKHRLIEVSTNFRLLDMIRNILITLAPGCIIKEDFVIIDNYLYKEIELSQTCLRHYNYDLYEFREYVTFTYNENNQVSY